MIIVVMEVAGDHGVPHGGISLRQMIEHVIGTRQMTAFRVEGDEGAGNVEIGLETKLENNGMDSLPVRYVEAGRAVLEKRREGEFAQFEAAVNR